MFRQIIGQDHAIGLLTGAIANERVAQAYLFHGSDGVGKFITALYFGMALNCYSAGEFRPCGVCTSCHKFLSFDHQDFIYLFPTPNLKMNAAGEIKDAALYKEYENYIENKKSKPWHEFFFSTSAEIRKESIMMLQQRLELSIHEANYRICIIENADQMNQPTANAFLKTLEEPPKNTIIILITERISMILPTVLSRCQSVYFNPLSRGHIESILRDKFDIDTPKARTAALIANGNLKTAIRIAEEKTSYNRQMAIEILDLVYRKQELYYLNLLAKTKDILSAAFVQEVLNFLAILINDVVIYQYKPDNVINIDQLDLIAKLAGNRTDFEEPAYLMLRTLEDYKRKLQGHANCNLLMLNVYYKLQKMIHP